MTENGTTKFTPVMEGARDAGAILNHVYRALQAKGYDPVTQIVGYLISGSVRRENRKQYVDKLAAAVILEQWLASQSGAAERGMTYGE